MKKRKTAKYKMTNAESLIFNLEKVTKNELCSDHDKEAARSLITWYLRNHELTEKQRKYADVLIFKMNGKERRIKDKKDEKFYLYAIKSSDSVKLGMSNNPNKRLKALQTSNKDKLRISWRFYVGKSRADAIKAERKLHRYCKEYHARGEWFELGALNKLASFNPCEKKVKA